MASSSITIIQLNAPTHFPIKLTQENFPVWRKQIQSTLIGLDLLDFIDGSRVAPSQFLSEKDKTANPAFALWFRQDQILISALLGTCSDTIQPLISSANTAKEAWDRLHQSFANVSRSRILSLKTKLAQNSKGTKPIAIFLNEMRAIADELALTQNPVSDDDLIVYIITRLGDDYSPIVAALKVRETPITFSDLFEKLTDHERSLQEKDSTTVSATSQVIATVNYTQRSRGRSHNQNGNYNRSPQNSNYSGNRRGGRGSYSGGRGRGSYRPDVVCQFCEYTGHTTAECRKLARFLKENNMSLKTDTSHSSAPIPAVNVTSSMAASSPQQWLFDSGASHHVVSNPASLQSYSDYGGPEEVQLGDGKTLAVSHTGFVQIPAYSKNLSLPNVLCVPNLRNNLVSIAKLCRTNHVSVEFFPSYFVVKDLYTGASLLRGENIDDIYCASFSRVNSQRPQLNVTTRCLSLLSEWHHKLGHPNNKVFLLVLRNIGL